MRLFWAVLLLASCARPGLTPRPDAGAASLPGLPTPTATATPERAIPQARPLDQDRPVVLRSRSLKVEKGGARTAFLGGVTVTQDTTTLLARELRSSDQGRTALATGGVHLFDPVRRVDATASEAEYGDALRQATLRGDVHLLSVDPYGLGVSLTGETLSWEALSQSARVEGGVTVLRGALSATAGSAEVLSAGAEVGLMGGVDARQGRNRAVAQDARLLSSDNSLTLDGAVRARFIPAEVRKAAADPRGVR